MKQNKLCLIATLIIFSIFFNACSFHHSKKSRKYNLNKEEYVLLEKFFRYFMFHKAAIYTLAGSKPLTEMIVIYEKLSKEQLREPKEKRKDYIYFQLNRSNKKDMEFYKRLSPEEKEKAYLIDDKDFIYNIDDLWTMWEKIQHRFPIKKKYLLIKKERPIDGWEKMYPEIKAVYDIFFVDIYKTALVIQENYELFKQAVGFDFDPVEVVFELEQNSSKFWDKIHGAEGWRYSHLWGLLFGFGRENSFSYLWKWRHTKGLNRTEKEKPWAETIKKKSSYKSLPLYSDKGAYSISSNFPVPAFASFSKNDPIVAKYENEKKQIKKLYKGKDFVFFTLELLTDLEDTAKINQK